MSFHSFYFVYQNQFVNNSLWFLPGLWNGVPQFNVLIETLQTMLCSLPHPTPSLPLWWDAKENWRHER